MRQNCCVARTPRVSRLQRTQQARQAWRRGVPQPNNVARISPFPHLGTRLAGAGPLPQLDCLYGSLLHFFASWGDARHYHSRISGLHSCVCCGTDIASGVREIPALLPC